MSGGGYDPRHFAEVASAERRHFWFRARNRVLLTVLAPLGDRLPAQARVLEIGCGTGNTLRVLERACPTALIVGMDAFAEGLPYARHETRARLLQGLAEAAPFRTRFHLIGLFDVLEHIDRDADALLAIRDLLEPGGHLVMTVPARRSLWSEIDVAAGHARRYEHDELIDRLASAGFDVRYITPFMTATYPALWVSRRLRRTNAKVYEELRMPAWLNAAFDASLRPERWILRAGGRLPFGSSLLAVAARGSKIEGQG